MDGTPPAALRPVLVVGAGGFVGGHVARGLAASGRPVLAASRGPLPDDGPRVHHVPYATLAGLPDAVRRACATHGLALPGAAVASIGGWQKGPALLDLDPDVWRATLDSHLTAHLDAVRAAAPLLTADRVPGGAPYVVLNGAARHEPMAGSGAVSVTGAALSMLVRVLRQEQTELGTAPGLRFHELVIDDAVAHDPRNETPERTVEPALVVRAVGEILDRPGADAVVHVAGS